MKNLTYLREIKDEVLAMTFSFKNVHRIMYLTYKCKLFFEESYPIPNKDIALDQTKKLIRTELMELINANDEIEIKKAFDQTLDGLKLILSYIK
jgi:hypothetical protein